MRGLWILLSGMTSAVLALCLTADPGLRSAYADALSPSPPSPGLGVESTATGELALECTAVGLASGGAATASDIKTGNGDRITRERENQMFDEILRGLSALRWSRGYRFCLLGVMVNEGPWRFQFGDLNDTKVLVKGRGLLDARRYVIIEGKPWSRNAQVESTAAAFRDFTPAIPELNGAYQPGFSLGLSTETIKQGLLANGWLPPDGKCIYIWLDEKQQKERLRFIVQVYQEDAMVVHGRQAIISGHGYIDRQSLEVTVSPHRQY